MKSWIVLLVALVLLGWVFVDFAFFFDHSLGVPKDVVIPKGMSLSGVAHLLEKEGITSSFRFLVFALLSRKTTPIAGQYRLWPGMPVASIVRLLSQGPPRVRVTFPEGFTAEQMAEVLERLGVCRKEEYLAFVAHPEHFARPWLSGAKSLEGFLFPDTYFLQVPTPPSEVIALQLDRFEELVLPLFSGKEASFLESIVLASIVEKEARLREEKPLVASVFLNRLRKNMRLQSCATVVYAIKKEKGVSVTSLREEDLAFPSPFNTYLHEGLPPHAICNPGLDAIRAVLEPAQTDYLYFVLQEDGKHAFARTYEEHLKNKRGAP